MSAESADLPFRAEYAKSGRAGCKACKGAIEKESLRLAVMVQSPMFDGKVPHWYHFSCFFKCQRVKNAADIAHYDQLRWDDQQKIKEKIVPVGEGGVSAGTSSNGSQGVPVGVATIKDFCIEYAKSGRSTCRDCASKIEKNVIRASKKDYESETARRFGKPQDMWYHLNCFAGKREELEFFLSGTQLPGFKSLKPEDQATVKQLLPQVASPVKRAAAADGAGPPQKKAKTEDDAIQKKLKTQNELIFKYRDQLKTLKKKEMQELFEENRQEVPTGEGKMLDALADCMAFGALEPCMECVGGQFKFDHQGYRCTGNLTEWTRCTAITREPKRKPFEIPDELQERYPFLSSYKPVVKTRFFPPNLELPTAQKASTSQASAAVASVRPLAGLKFAFIGNLETPQPMLIKKLEEFGGKVVHKIDKSLAAVVSSKEEVTKMTKKMESVRDNGIHVVEEGIFQSITASAEPVNLITKYSICEWGNEALLRSKIPKPKEKSGKEKSFFTKSVPSHMKVVVKGKAAVDPDSGLEDEAHVLEEGSNVYNAVLGLVDISKGSNSFYKLQLLSSDRGNKFWVFRAWGRVGTTIGGNKLSEYKNKEGALDEFLEIYETKTGNPWSKRKNFQKQPGLFYPIDVDYGQDDETLTDLCAKTDKKCSLDAAIQSLIRMIFDIESMKKTLVEYELDLTKMPLGKLSRSQIEKAYTVLRKLQAEVNKSTPTESTLLDLANQFYTLIPHDFGTERPPLIKDAKTIQTKCEMLDNLLDIEMAYSIHKKSAEKDAGEHPIDAHYKRLNTDIQTLSKDSEEFKLFKSYVKNTHAETHSSYKLHVDEIFKIARKDEESRYRPFTKLPNRKLLWHGSRATNYAGILSQGLRIAPPEAPTTGYMFGKGIYFADMVSKSANYCYTSHSDSTGLLLLCEVALGNMHELTRADYIEKLPAGKHSTFGMGKTAPDPAGAHKLPNGVEIPMGKGVLTDVANSALLYNEYIVYDVAQVNIKYLLKVKFRYNY